MADTASTHCGVLRQTFQNRQIIVHGPGQRERTLQKPESSISKVIAIHVQRIFMVMWAYPVTDPAGPSALKIQPFNEPVVYTILQLQLCINPLLLLAPIKTSASHTQTSGLSCYRNVYLPLMLSHTMMLSLILCCCFDNVSLVLLNQALGSCSMLNSCCDKGKRVQCRTLNPACVQTFPDISWRWARTPDNKLSYCDVCKTEQKERESWLFTQSAACVTSIHYCIPYTYC